VKPITKPERLLHILCGSLFGVQKSPRSVPGEKAILENPQIFQNCE